MKPVTDPALLEQLNASPVTDPALLAQLNGPGSTQEQRAAVRKAGQKAELDKELAKEYSGPLGALANYGAGVDNVVQGAKQLFGFGRPDEEIKDTRKLKKTLGDSTLGGGVAQTVGEMVTTAPLTMGAGGALAKAGTKALPKAAAWLSSQGGRAVNAGTAVRAGAEGAVGGALAETTDDESRAANSVMGAGLGAAIPAAIAPVGKLVKTLGKKAAPERAAGVFEKQLGKEGMTQVEDALHDPVNQNTLLPLSTAARAQNTQLASLERGARSRGDWGFNHDKNVAEAAWGNIKGATGNADELASRVADREAMMQASKEHLAGFADPTNLAKAHKDVSEVAELLRQTPVARQNPEVTALLGQTEAMLAHPEVTAGDYASQYWRLSNMLDDTKLAAEPREIILKLRETVGKAADTATGDKEFSDMLGRYVAEQEHVGRSEASKAVRDTFVSPEGIPKTTKNWGDTPEVTSTQLRKTLAAKGENQYGNVMDDSTREGLSNVQKELSQHELWQPRNSPGPAGLDIENPLSVVSTGRDNPFNYLPLVKGGANWLFSGSRKATTEAADKALQSPAEWAKMMEAYRKSKSPLSPTEYAERLRRQLTQLPGRVGVAELGGE